MQTNQTPTEGTSSANQEAKSALRDAPCSALSIPGMEPLIEEIFREIDTYYEASVAEKVAGLVAKWCGREIYVDA